MNQNLKAAIEGLGWDVSDNGEVLRIENRVSGLDHDFVEVMRYLDDMDIVRQIRHFADGFDTDWFATAYAFEHELKGMPESLRHNVNAAAKMYSDLADAVEQCPVQTVKISAARSQIVNMTIDVSAEDLAEFESGYNRYLDAADWNKAKTTDSDWAVYDADSRILVNWED